MGEFVKWPNRAHRIAFQLYKFPASVAVSIVLPNQAAFVAAHDDQAHLFA